MTHTKGPWYRRGPLHEDESGVAGGIDVDVVAQSDEDGEAPVSILDGLSVADADLIAAAPELLVACQVALNDRMYKEWPAIAELLMAAIAKAEGKS